MGRGYIVEALVEQYLVNLQTVHASCISGILIGQCSSQRDYVVLAAQTPQKDCGAVRGCSLGDLDADWVTEHGRQVSRMLPGGLSVLGVFLITSPDLSKEAQNTLRKLVYAMEKLISMGRLWNLTEEDVSERVGLHICSKTKKAVCRTFDVRDPKSSARPADWKYQSGVSDSWPVLKCSVDLDLYFPLSETSSENLENSVKIGLQKWAKQMESSVCLINGKHSDSDAELLTGLRKNAKGHHPNFRVQIMLPMMSSALGEQRSSAAAEACGGSLTLAGVLQCRAYLHSHKLKARQAAEAIKRDIMNTLSSRTEMFFEDLLINEGDGGKGKMASQQPLPQRVFAPLPGTSLSLCDYMFPDEGAAEVGERFKEMLDFDIPEEQIDMTQEVITVNSEVVLEEKLADALQAQAVSPAIQKVAHRYVGVALAAGIAVLASAASLLYLND
ncbi:protein odr-4 homolog isoform X1 [Paramormyrops kingsleyae]|uniref:protein odr-4 homolog isoform X1 n=2 Tax=Paramormyrops kingsleyae TaxID=1676925 RepID=UPI000CD5CD5B|nr:protein odr-4 homolog isoform X1 [Paramormyrops kingsleyae]XP_023662180.1 protein odr-4 homolog isoform X1 [Paramormyrops kingsleyae]XP_023662181.1 protein odr-4 homolog isoform X1 [Paramormyrops kingsleyae]